MPQRPTEPWVPRDAIRVLVRLFRIAEIESKKAGLSLPQYRTLMMISRGDQRAADIADNAAVSRPAISVLVAGLEERGLLRRRPVVVGDRRGIHVAITEEGRAALNHVERQMAAALGGVLSATAPVGKLAEELRGLEDALDVDLEWDLQSRAAAGDSEAPPWSMS